MILQNAERQDHWQVRFDCRADLAGEHHLVTHRAFLTRPSTGLKTCPTLRPRQRGRKTPHMKGERVASVEIVDVRKSYGDQK
eukprot:gene11776-14986_t